MAERVATLSTQNETLGRDNAALAKARLAHDSGAASRSVQRLITATTRAHETSGPEPKEWPHRPQPKVAG